MLKALGMIMGRSSHMGTYALNTCSHQARVKPLFYLSSKQHIQGALQSTASRGNEKTNQDKLARQPVPPLEKTLSKFLRTVKPFLNDNEYQATEEAVKSFMAEGGCGRILQRLLEERAARMENWLADWWLNAAYLGYRLPVLVHSSPAIQLPHQTFKSQEEHLQYASKLITAALEYKKIIDDGKLAPEMMGKVPLDMAQYHKIFGTYRIPKLPLDDITYLRRDKSIRHIVVAHNNQYFSVDVLDNELKPLSLGQIMAQLTNVVSESPCPVTPVGILTSEHRDTWAKFYATLSQDPVNCCSLEAIRDSLFVVCLDGPAPDLGAPNAFTVGGLQTMHGGGSRASGGNRWYDKTMQFVVACSGEVGSVYEHSPAEGGPIANVMDHIEDYVHKHPGPIELDSKAHKGYTLPQKLNFNLTPEIEQGIAKAQQNLDKLVDDVDLFCYSFPAYGKDFIKANKMSPDSYIQIALQLAFYRLHKTPGAHYESAANRKYLHGRTEAIRSCSLESVEFAKAMLDNSKSAEEKVAALKAAINSHKDYAVQAVNGFGVDRHLLGLKLIAIENGIEVPQFYQDTGFVRSSHWRVSTSQVPFRCDGLLSFGPVVSDGYGCCYNPRNKNINFGISAFRSHPETSAKCFQESLKTSLESMHDILAKTQLTSKL